MRKLQNLNKEVSGFLSRETFEASKGWLSEYIADAPLGVELPWDLQTNNDLGVSSYLDVVVDADVLPATNSDDRHLILRWLAAFIILLSRYSSSGEVSIGIKDQRLGIMPLILRSIYDPDEKPDERIERLDTELLSVVEHLDGISFDDLYALMPCQAMLVEAHEKLPSDVRIALCVADDGASFRLYLDRSRFSQEAAERVAAHLKAIYKAFETSSSSPVATISWLSNDECQRLLTEFSGQTDELPPIGIVHHLFFHQAEQNPNRVALVASDRTMTFGQLRREADYLARLLVKQGVGSEIRVGVCLPRTSNLVVGLLGVLIAGGCYVPLDPDYPDERLCYMLSDADCAFVVVNQQTEAKIRGLGYRTFLLPTNLSGEQIDHPLTAEEVTPSNLAYIIYTSGSTGRPKGIGVEHRNVYSFLWWAGQVFDEEERGGMLAATSVCFDLSIFEIFTPLCWGGTVHLVANVLALADYSQREQIRLVNTVPSAMAALLSLGPLPRSVTTVNLAGETFPGYLARELWSCAHVKRVLNLYGPSEDTVYSTWAELSSDDLANPPIGRPLPGTTTYILDSSGQLLPIGVAGELYLGGSGLARGYWNKAKQTAERFVFKTFDHQLPLRLYRTGDRVRFRGDGSIEHLGRLDEQVKVRGFRIELSEISSVLVEFETIEEAITIVHKEADGNKQLVAYYVATDTPDKNSLVTWLRERLPYYMVPSSFVQLPELPKTLNNKIDKKRLPIPTAISKIKITNSPKAKDPVEGSVFEVWTSVLGYTPTKDQNFFAMGGNSLQAVQIIARVQNQFGITIPLTKFLEQPTPEGLITLVRQPNTILCSSDHSHQFNESEEKTSLTCAESRLWVQQQFNPKDTSYLLSVHLHLEGNVEITALVNALQKLLKHHKSLRRAVVLKDGLPHPVFLPIESVPIVVEQSVEPSAVKSAIATLSQRDSSSPFELADEAPTRICILPVRSGAIELLLTIHHLSFDDWSLKILAHDLVTAYENPLSSLPPITPMNLAARESALSTMPEKHTAIHRWVQRIGNMSFNLQLGDILPKQTPRSNRGATYEVELLQDISEAVTAIARRQQTTKFAVLMAAFQSLLWLETGIERFLIGIALAGRSQVETERIIGCFVNMLPLPVEINPHLSFESLVKEVSQGVFELITHQDIPLEHWLEALRKYRSIDSFNMVRVACGAHNAREGKSICGEQINVDARFLPSTKARLDLTLWVEEREDKLYLLWTYATDLFTHEDVVSRHLKFEQLLMRVKPNQEISLKDLVSLSNPEASPKTNLGIRTMTSNKSPRRFDSRISLKPKRNSDFIRVEKNWLNSSLPLLIEATIPGLSLAEWIDSRRDSLREDIVHHGGILFRGFSMEGASDFAAAARAFAPDLLDYKEKSSPRTLVENQIYTSTDHPPDQPIFLHNEQSYTVNWPVFIMFFCLLEASYGGRTPIADNRKIIKHLPDKTINRFAEHGILYVRN